MTGGTLVGMTAVGAAQQNGHRMDESFQLGGRVQGWQGRAPNSIKGQKNPTLKLQTGQVYQVTWTNMDGQPHDFALQDSNGNNLKVIYPNVRTNENGGGGDSMGNGGGNMGSGSTKPPKNAISKTKIVQKKGATQTLRFVATSEIEKYYCTVHPTTMVGKVRTSGKGGSGGSGDHSGHNGDHMGGNGHDGDHSGGSGHNGDHMGGNGDHSGNDGGHMGDGHNGGSNTDHDGDGN
ncbi:MULTISPECIES: hypothetical protein [unclassified Haladaptatus]|uniref:hypothetical protein n=1 Tax=unclassified Haladaptatus TaxID=2622732 RepID=UPI00209C53A3|nr:MULTISPECIES: hypothetical protein [unclassified Haladaptatus]MCO8256258.1 hypothetical protein [Haladaptatus sp. AB618]